MNRLLMSAVNAGTVIHIISDLKIAREQLCVFIHQNLSLALAVFGEWLQISEMPCMLLKEH